MDNENNALEKARNKKRIFDQLTSMHFKLSDEYKFLYLITDIIEIIISVILCGITFLDFQIYFHISNELASLIVKICSILFLAFTLIKRILGYAQLSEKHSIAGKMFSQAKLDIDAKISEWEVLNTKDENIIHYVETNFVNLNDLPQIPDKKFCKLKHWHQEKVEMSKFLDSHKNEFWLICWLKFRFFYKSK